MPFRIRTFFIEKQTHRFFSLRPSDSSPVIKCFNVKKNKFASRIHEPCNMEVDRKRILHWNFWQLTWDRDTWEDSYKCGHLKNNEWPIKTEHCLSYSKKKSTKKSLGLVQFKLEIFQNCNSMSLVMTQNAAESAPRKKQRFVIGTFLTSHVRHMYKESKCFHEWHRKIHKNRAHYRKTHNLTEREWERWKHSILSDSQMQVAISRVSTSCLQYN